MDYYKLSVKSFKKNAGGIPLLHPDGSPVMETFKQEVERSQAVAALDVHGHPQMDEEGKTVMRQTVISETLISERTVIPDYVEDKEFFIYQQVDEKGSSHIGYFDQAGNPFSFEEGGHYEYSIVETNATPEFINQSINQ